jgi:hypothetical protein
LAMRDFNTAQDELAALGEWVGIVSDADAHGETIIAGVRVVRALLKCGR